MPEFEPRPALGSFNHVAIEVTDFTASRNFYGNILGLAELPMPQGLMEKGICSRRVSIIR